MKQKSRQNCKQKKNLYKTPANYYQAKRKRAGRQLNQELNGGKS